VFKVDSICKIKRVVTLFNMIRVLFICRMIMYQWRVQIWNNYKMK